MAPVFFLGGFFLALIYGALTVPATVWSVQVAHAAGKGASARVNLALASAQAIWAVPVVFGLFHGSAFWQMADTPLRLACAVLAGWWAFQVKSSPPVTSLSPAGGEASDPSAGLARRTFNRAWRMPWRLPIWFVLFFAVGIHLRGPGFGAAALAAAGTFFGLLVWYFHFSVIALLFSRTVPEAISLKSLNKLRLLAFTAFLGLGVLLLAPLIILGGV